MAEQAENEQADVGSTDQPVTGDGNGEADGSPEGLQVQLDRYSAAAGELDDVQVRFKVDGGARDSSATLRITVDLVGRRSQPQQTRRRLEDLTIVMTRPQLHRLASQLVRYAHPGRN